MDAAFNGIVTRCRMLVTQVAKLLLENGADVSETSDKGDTALHVAVAHGLTKTVELLWPYGANPRAQNKAGESHAFTCKEA